MGRKKKTDGPGKGNWTRGENRKGCIVPNTVGLVAANKAKAEKVAFYKEVAEQQAKVIRYGQPYALTLRDNLIRYIEDTDRAGKKYTIAGMIRASGLSQDTYKRYKSGEADHLLYAYMDEHGFSYDQEDQVVINDDGEEVLLSRLSTIIKNAELCIQEQREEACSSNRGNPAGNIFLLKAQQGFRDDPDKVQQTNTLNIQVASLDEAKQALKRLSE